MIARINLIGSELKMKTKLTKYSQKHSNSLEFLRVAIIGLLISVSIIAVSNLIYAIKLMLFG